ncbi:hypothetical protein MNBD_GAMMA18-560 [hydrothermal vent metagenome]|uniref:Uncharacterized protein n=1 Tax=hydrothermal vent metagenome TaxID=652676 RepID=A0A3B0ZZL4_9ZZZZ
MSKSKVIGTYKKSDGSTFTVTDDDYKKMREMTDEEVHEAALSDPDAQPLTEEQLKNLKPVNPNRRKPTSHE